MALIFMLDNERDACRLVERILIASGHEVQAFTDESDALGWLQTNRPQLALLDIKLNGTNVFGVLKYIRDRRPEIKVMIITGSPSVESARKATELGIEDCLVKPVEIAELEEHVNRALGTDSVMQ